MIKRLQKEIENRDRGLQYRIELRGSIIRLQEEYYTWKQQESEKEKRTLNDEIERLRGGFKEREIHKKPGRVLQDDAARKRHRK